MVNFMQRVSVCTTWQRRLQKRAPHRTHVYPLLNPHTLQKDRGGSTDAGAAADM
jgi:hypothetical protein